MLPGSAWFLCTRIGRLLTSPPAVISKSENANGNGAVDGDEELLTCRTHFMSDCKLRDFYLTWHGHSIFRQSKGGKEGWWVGGSVGRSGGGMLVVLCAIAKVTVKFNGKPLDFIRSPHKIIVRCKRFVPQRKWPGRGLPGIQTAEVL